MLVQDYLRNRLIQIYLEETKTGPKPKPRVNRVDDSPTLSADDAPSAPSAPVSDVPPTGSRSRSGYFGVYRYGQRWAAVLRQKRIGVYATAEEAARAYDSAAKEVGETKLNFAPSTHTSLNASGYRGVYAYGKRWAAYLSIDGKRVSVGVFDTAEQAARAYDVALTSRGGNPTELNFPQIPDPTRVFIDRLARGEQLSREDFIEFERASNIYDAALANKPVQTSLITLEPLVAEEAPKVLQRRDDVRESIEPKRVPRRGDFDIFDLGIDNDDEPAPGDSGDAI